MGRGPVGARWAAATASELLRRLPRAPPHRRWQRRSGQAAGSHRRSWLLVVEDLDESNLSPASVEVILEEAAVLAVPSQRRLGGGQQPVGLVDVAVAVDVLEDVATVDEDRIRPVTDLVEGRDELRI